MGNLTSRSRKSAATSAESAPGSSPAAPPPSSSSSSPPPPTSGDGEAEAAHWRAEADRQAKLRADCFDRSKKAYASGNGALAKELSVQGKEHDRLLKEADKKAADAVFKAKNAKVGEDEIDLHGLQVKEALERTEARLTQCMEQGKDHLVIIVGRGSHSVDGIAKIKPAVQNLLKKYAGQFTVELDTPNAGCVTVRFIKGAPPPTKRARRSSPNPCAIL